MAESISTLEGLQSYKAALEAPLYQQEAKDQASLLQTSAEAQRMKLASVKEEAAKTATARATLSSIAQQHQDLNLGNVQDQIKLADLAINQSRNNPVLMEKFREEKMGFLKQLAEETKVQAGLREAERAQKYDTLSEALSNPMSAESLLSSADPALKHFGEMITSRKPIPQFRDVNGKPKLYSQLSEDEQARFSEKVLSGVAPKGDAAALAKYSQHEIDWARESERRRNDDLRAALKEQDIAAKRDKITADKEAKRAKEEDRTVQMHKADTEYADKKAKIEAALTAAKDTGFFTSDAEKATISVLEQQLKDIETAHEDAIKMYGKKDVTVKSVKTQGQGTKENPIKLD